jgi:zinc-ribbon domain
MFCDRCGHQLRDDAQFCSSCGKQLTPSPVRPPAAAVAVIAPDGRVGRHLKIVASLWLIYALLRLMETFWIFFIGRTFLPSIVDGIVSNGPWGRGGPFPGGFPLDRLISGGLMFAGFWVAAFAVLELVTAWGLFERRPWARILALVLGFLALLRFPFGTALGIYTLWVLLPGLAAQEYHTLARENDRLTHSQPGM